MQLVKAVTARCKGRVYRSHLSVGRKPKDFNPLYLIRGLMMDLAFMRSQKAKEPIGRNLFYAKYREGAKIKCG